MFFARKDWWRVRRTLQDCVIAARKRVGEPSGLDEGGAYWVVGRCGLRPGVPHLTEAALVLRHYRSGEVVAEVEATISYVNDSVSDEAVFPAPLLLRCPSVEQVITLLMSFGLECDGEYREYPEYRPHRPACAGPQQRELTEMLSGLGLVAALPAPDEVAA